MAGAYIALDESLIATATNNCKVKLNSLFIQYFHFSGPNVEEGISDDVELQQIMAKIKQSEGEAKREYGQLLLDASKLFKKKKVKLPDVKLTWLGCDREMSDEARKAKDITSFLMAIGGTQGPYSYQNIGKLLVIFCKREGEELVAKYEEKLKCILRPQLIPVERSGRQFMVKINKKSSKENILDFQITLAKLLFNWKFNEFILEDARDGCIELIYVIPTELAEKIEKSDLSSMHEDFKDAKIVEFWVEMNGNWKSIYNAQEEELTRVAERTALTMAVIGSAGQGKSTLVNSLLLMDPDTEEAAATAGEGVSISHDVVCYTRTRDKVNVKIWDTPGLHDTMINPEVVIKLLRERAGDDVDLFLYCVAYHPGLRQHNEGRTNVIKFLTKHFGTEFWRKTLLVLTMVNTVEIKSKIPNLTRNIESGLKYALRSAGVPEEIVQRQELILAGLGEEPLAINEVEKVEWNRKLFLRCLDTVQTAKRATFTQVRHGKSFWRNFLEFVSMASAAGTLAEKSDISELLAHALKTTLILEYLDKGMRRKSRKTD